MSTVGPRTPAATARFIRFIINIESMTDVPGAGLEPARALLPKRF